MLIRSQSAVGVIKLYITFWFIHPINGSKQIIETQKAYNAGTQCDVANTGCVIQGLDSVQFLHDIFFCFESDSIVVSLSSRTGFLGADVV